MKPQRLVSGASDNAENTTHQEATGDTANLGSDDHPEDDQLLNNSSSPHFQLLWKFESSADTKYQNSTASDSCSCIDINHQNQDLIASGYGKPDFGNKQTGSIKFWTLKNPINPVRIYDTPSGVCSINFSKIHPSLLAVGLFDGNVSVYDVRSKSSEPTLKSDLLGENAAHDSGGSGQAGLDMGGGGGSQSGRNKNSQSKHNRAVWNVMWENTSSNNGKSVNANNKQDQDSTYNSVNNHYGRHALFSISSDGIVKQWSMKKGFQSTSIMSLKRVPNLAAPRGSGIDSNTNTIRSRQASGLCFDFPTQDSTVQYYVGTEDGIVHKCSVSYNEQVLRSYYGHTAPVYGIKCNPFDSDKFLTCSADWTIKVWDQAVSTPMINLHSNNSPVNDIAWSHFNSCVFASASRNGKLELWDLETNKKDPLISHQIPSNQVKCVTFVPESPSMLVGLDTGHVHVYRINNVRTSMNGSHLQQITRLFRSMQKNG